MLVQAKAPRLALPQSIITPLQHLQAGFSSCCPAPPPPCILCRSLLALATSTLGTMWDAALVAAPAGQGTGPDSAAPAAAAVEGQGTADSVAAGAVAGLLQEGLIDLLLGERGASPPYS